MLIVHVMAEVVCLQVTLETRKCVEPVKVSEADKTLTTLSNVQPGPLHFIVSFFSVVFYFFSSYVVITE